MPHMQGTPGISIREGAAKFFNDRIGQYFASNALDFSLRFFAAQATIERKLEILSLADFLQALITHLLEGSVDGFALGIRTLFLSET